MREENDAAVHGGHRARMRNKFLRYGAAPFDSYELLEMLLYYVIPYRDTNPLSHRLMSAFGSLSGVFSAPEEELCAVEGIGTGTAAFLRRIPSFGEDILWGDTDGISLASYGAMRRYVLSCFRGIKTPQVVMFLLDNRMHLLARRKMADTDFASAAVRPQPFVETALSCGAAAVVLAHNHPRGPLFPSDGDRAANVLFKNALTLAGVTLTEHFLVCGEEALGLFLTQDAALCHPDATAEPSEEPEQDLFTPDSRDVLLRMLTPVIRSSQGREDAVTALLDRFFTSSRVFCAEGEELALLPGVGEAVAVYLKLLAALTTRTVTDSFVPGKIYTEGAVTAFLAALFRTEAVETVYMLSWDASHRLCAVDCVCRGSVNSSGVTPRRFLEIALRKRAASVTLAHNHPSGEARPSREDLFTTANLRSAFAAAGIDLTEHYVVAGGAVEGILHNTSSALTQEHGFRFASGTTQSKE